MLETLARARRAACRRRARRARRAPADRPQRRAGDGPRPSTRSTTPVADSTVPGPVLDGDRAGAPESANARRTADVAAREERVGAEHEVRRPPARPRGPRRPSRRARAVSRSGPSSPKPLPSPIRRSTCSPRWPVTTVTRVETGLGELAQQQRDHGLAVDREHRLGVALGQRPQPRSEAGGDHHGLRGHARRERSATRPRRRAVRPSPCRITRSSARSSLAPRAAAAALVSGGPKRASASAAANRRAVGAELVAHELPQLIGRRARPNVEALVDEEVCELAPGGAGEPPRIARQVAKPAADDLRGADRAAAATSRRAGAARAPPAGRRPRLLRPRRCRSASRSFCSRRSSSLAPPFAFDAGRPAEREGRVAGVESRRRGAVVPGRATRAPASGRTRASRSRGTRPRPRHARCDRSRPSCPPRACRS